jgi:TfoX/Sxy family transcriptional regulator of competence genes
MYPADVGRQWPISRCAAVTPTASVSVSVSKIQASPPVGGAWQTGGMGYDTELADRVRELVRGRDGGTEKRMFGGLAFLINGNMAVAASSQGGLLVRVDPADADTLVTDPHADRFVMRDRPMNGWLHIDPAGLTTAAQLERWVAHGVAYASCLPAKR